MHTRVPAPLSLLLFLALLLPTTSHAAGFALYEWGARGLGMAGSLVAHADDPSALAYNPAGMTQLEGTQVMAGFSAIAPTAKVTLDGVGTTKGEDNVWIPPHAYVTWQLSDRYWLGLGVFSRFGLGTEYDPNWEGRYHVYEAVIRSVSVNPNLAMKLTDTLSGSIGIEGMWFEFTQKKKAFTPFGDVDAKLLGDSIGYGLNLGLHYRPLDWLALGASYRSEITQELRGDATYRNNMLGSPFFPNTGAKGTVTLPATYMAGVAVFPTDRLSIEASVVLTAWSSYEDLTIHLDEPATPGGNPVIAQRKNWKDVYRYQIGLEYKATDWLDLRLGYTYDEDPIDTDFADFMVPSNDRQLYSVGAGLHWNSWTLDLAYTYLDIKTRRATVRGLETIPEPFRNYEARFHDGYAHIASVSLGYAF